MKSLPDLIAEKQKEIDEHPAMKFANAAVILQAVRSGTGGYDGKEHLGHFLERVMKETALATLAAVRVEDLRKNLVVDNWENGHTKVCNPRCHDSGKDEVLAEVSRRGKEFIGDNEKSV